MRQKRGLMRPTQFSDQSVNNSRKRRRKSKKKSKKKKKKAVDINVYIEKDLKRFQFLQTSGFTDHVSFLYPRGMVPRMQKY